MDPACENKIKLLQKYVPFLAKLIEQLANDSEKESKLIQMQLLYDLLNKPDNSVKIETLDKCEEVLSRVFTSSIGSNDEVKDASEQNVTTISSSSNKIGSDESCDVLSKVDEQNTILGDEKNPSSDQTSGKDNEQSVLVTYAELNKVSLSQPNSPENTHSQTSNREGKCFLAKGSCRDKSEPVNHFEGDLKLHEKTKSVESNSEDSIEVCTGNENDIIKALNKIDDTREEKNMFLKDPSSQLIKSIDVLPGNEEESTQNLTSYSNSESSEKEKVQQSVSISILGLRDKGEHSATSDKCDNSQVRPSNIVSETMDPLTNDGNNGSFIKDINQQISNRITVNLSDTGEPKEPFISDSNIGDHIATKEQNPHVGESNSSSNFEIGEHVRLLETDSKKDDGHDLLKCGDPEEDDCQNIANFDHDEPFKLLVEGSTETAHGVCAKNKSPQVDERHPEIFSESEAALRDVPINTDDGNSNPQCEKNKSGDQEVEKIPETDSFIGDQQSDVIMQSQSEMSAFKIISAESLATPFAQSLSENDDLDLLVPLENKERETPNDCENQSIGLAIDNSQNDPDLDPLEPSSTPPENLLDILKANPVVNGCNNRNHKNEENDEDDDVLLIETRSSPICLDSDPEDNQMNQTRTFKQLKTTANIQKEKQKNCWRKTAENVLDTIVQKMVNQRNISVKKIQNLKKTKPGFLVKRDPKALMETINLIDSDSEDEPPKNVERKKSIDDDVIIVRSTQPARKLIPLKNASGKQSLKQNPRLPSKATNKPIGKPATAQSNFLNAVNLQPAPKSDSNPASFSAQLSNKKVLIPNAFYGNPSYNRKSSSSSMVTTIQDESSSNDSVRQSTRSPSNASSHNFQDKMLKDWLEGFLTNFASPLQIASHACFVLLQRVLKYRFFQRLKEARVHLNTLAKNFVSETMDVQMLLDLRNVFLENDNLTDAGRRFCRFATNDAFGKPVALTTDSRTGKVTCRTRIGSKVDHQNENRKTSIPEKPTSSPQVSPPNSASSTVTSANPVTSTPSGLNSSAIKRSRKIRKLSDGLTTPDVDDDDNDYTPNMGERVPEEEIVTERKRSLRTNRTKRKEAGFTYSEDHDDEEFEALAKKIEDKKREELRLAEEKEIERERENEKKMKKTVAKKTTSKRQGIAPTLQIGIETQKEPSRKKLRLVDTEILGNADDDLLTPTWVEAGDDDADCEVDSLLDFEDDPEPPAKPEKHENIAATENNPEASEAQDSDDSEPYLPCFDVGTNKLLKNTDRNLHVHSQTFDYCVHCLKRVPRTVHHYVNEHRSSEVFTSRLRNRDIRRLLTTSNLGFVHLYKGNQQQYAAHCIFCDKESKFLLPYWFEHFTMHTGEYSFKCSGCHIRKPTRSLLTNHFQSGNGCPKKGTAVRLHFFDTKSHQIEAHICSICNYVQVHRKNVVRHLRNNHDVEAVLPNHIIKVVLLQISAPYSDQEAISYDESQLSLLQNSDDEDNGINGTSMVSLGDNSLMMQNSFTDNDDLSFMICGMLDVQTNLSSSGDFLGNNKTNTVDNK